MKLTELLPILDRISNLPFPRSSTSIYGEPLPVDHQTKESGVSHAAKILPYPTQPPSNTLLDIDDECQHLQSAILASEVKIDKTSLMNEPIERQIIGQLMQLFVNGNVFDSEQQTEQGSLANQDLVKRQFYRRVISNKQVLIKIFQILQYYGQEINHMAQLDRSIVIDFIHGLSSMLQQCLNLGSLPSSSLYFNNVREKIELYHQAKNLLINIIHFTSPNNETLVDDTIDRLFQLARDSIYDSPDVSAEALPRDSLLYDVKLWKSMAYGRPDYVLRNLHRYHDCCFAKDDDATEERKQKLMAMVKSNNREQKSTEIRRECLCQLCAETQYQCPSINDEKLFVYTQMIRRSFEIEEDYHLVLGVWNFIVHSAISSCNEDLMRGALQFTLDSMDRILNSIDSCTTLPSKYLVSITGFLIATPSTLTESVNQSSKSVIRSAIIGKLTSILCRLLVHLEYQANPLLRDPCLSRFIDQLSLIFHEKLAYTKLYIMPSDEDWMRDCCGFLCAYLNTCFPNKVEPLATEKIGQMIWSGLHHPSNIHYCWQLVESIAVQEKIPMLYRRSPSSSFETDEELLFKVFLDVQKFAFEESKISYSLRSVSRLIRSYYYSLSEEHQEVLRQCFHDQIQLLEKRSKSYNKKILLWLATLYQIIPQPVTRLYVQNRFKICDEAVRKLLSIMDQNSEDCATIVYVLLLLIEEDIQNWKGEAKRRFAYGYLDNIEELLTVSGWWVDQHRSYWQLFHPQFKRVKSEAQALKSRYAQ